MQLAMTHLRHLNELMKLIQTARAYKVLRLLGRWNWIESSSSVIKAADEMCFDVDCTRARETKKEA